MDDQLTLIQAESDEALLLPREQMQKRYTASTADKLELKRNYILDLLAFGFPVVTVAERTQSSTRIVNILGAKYAQLLSEKTQDIVKILRAKAMKAAFYADEKMPAARLGELGVFMGIALQRAGEMELAAGNGALDKDDAIELENENEALKSAREFLNGRKLLKAETKNLEAMNA